MPRATDLVFALLLAFDLESASADANKAPRPLKGRRTHSIRARRYLVLEERRRLKRNAVLNSHVAFATNRKRRRLVAAEYEKKIQFLPLPSADFLVAGRQPRKGLLALSFQASKTANRHSLLGLPDAVLRPLFCPLRSFNSLLWLH